MRTLCRLLMALPLMALSINLCSAQNTNTPVEYSIDRIQDFTPFKTSQFEEDYYLLLSFDQLPGKAELAQLTRYGVELLAYKSNKTYLAKFPANINPSILKRLKVNKVKTQLTAEKMDERLIIKDYPEWATEENGKVDVAIIFHEGTALGVIQNIITEYNIQVIEDKHRGSTTIVARVDEDKINEIAAKPVVAFLDMEQEPAQILNHESCINQKVNVLNSSLPGGFGLMGEGVTIGVGDGGELGNHIDFGDRVINEANGTYSSFGDHGDHVAGIIAGAGNLHPRHRGMAPMANIVTQKTSQITYNTESYFNNYGMVLTNNSYGTSFNCNTNGSYNYSAQTLDWQLREFPKVLHVFAAGNSGGGICEPFPQGYHTVLRYYQSAKNVLTVGMAEENRVIANSSSRGPVKDGRIKPEIIGVGRNVISTSRDYNYSTKGGTSMASPAVVGTLGLLVEKYRTIHNGENPDGALIKSIACNTADDLGNTGPDFIHGFGLINGRRAAEVLEQNQYHKDEIVDGETKVHTINVPQGVRQVKILLYWNDKEAEAYPDKALVNNLDISILTPGGATVLPWVLDHTATGVDELATQGVDDLNNIEQVTIDVPAAGIYNIVINGKEVPFGPQEFYTTYDFVKDEVVMTHPFGGESFSPDTNEYISWDADINNTNTFKLEYSIDGGNTWLMIAPELAAHVRTYNWTVPLVYSPDVKIRVSKNGSTVSGENNSFFHIMGQPSNVIAEPTCENQMMVSWNPAEYAMHYDVYMYDGVKMTNIGTTEEEFYVVDENLQLGEMYWFAVRAVGLDGSTSMRTVAVNGITEDIELCPWEDNPVVEYVGEQLLGRALTSDGLDDETVSILVKNLGTNNLESFDMYYSVNGGDAVHEVFGGFIETGETQLVEFATKADLSQAGFHEVNMWVEINNNNFIYRDSQVNILVGEQMRNDPMYLPFEETFENAVPAIYQASVLGLEGCRKWDFKHHRNGELEIEPSGILTLRPLGISDGTLVKNSAVLTMNLSKYSDMEENVDLNLEYYTEAETALTGPVDGKNQVFVRGKDTDDWLLLYQFDNATEDWVNVEGLSVSDLLKASGQHFTASTQVRLANKNAYTLRVSSLQFEASQISLEDELFNDFTLSQIGGDVLLTWTPVETEEIYFEIEVLDLINDSDVDDDDSDSESKFKIIGSVMTERTATQPFYTFWDNNPGVKGKRYYRVKQVCLDGNITFSPVLSITINDKDVDGVFPNPFFDEFFVAHSMEQEGTVDVQVIDATGKVVFKQNLVIGSGEQFIPVQLAENHPVGVYFVKVTSKGQYANYHKILKQ